MYRMRDSLICDEIKGLKRSYILKVMNYLFFKDFSRVVLDFF